MAFTLKTSRKPISEIEPLDTATEAAFASLVQLAQKAAGGRSFHTGGGKILAIEGAAVQGALLSVSGTVWSRRRHFTTRQPGTLLHRTVTRQSKRYDGM